KDFSHLRRELARGLALARREHRGKGFGDLRVVEQKENRENDRRERNEQSGSGIYCDRAERSDRAADKARGLRCADSAGIKAVRGQLQCGEMLLKRALG